MDLCERVLLRRLIDFICEIENDEKVSPLSEWQFEATFGGILNFKCCHLKTICSANALVFAYKISAFLYWKPKNYFQAKIRVFSAFTVKEIVK